MTDEENGLTMDAYELLTTTRAVRKRLDNERPVPYEVLAECVEIALQAPEGVPGWAPHFVIVLDPAIRDQLGDIYTNIGNRFLDQFKGARDGQANAPESDGLELDTQYLQEANAHMTRAPAMVLVGILPGEHAEDYMLDGDESALSVASKFGAMLPAAWSFMLALRMRGLGATWTTMHLEEADAVAGLLNLPKNFTQGVLFPVGYYTGETFKKAKRVPAADVIHRDGW